MNCLFFYNFDKILSELRYVEFEYLPPLSHRSVLFSKCFHHQLPGHTPSRQCRFGICLGLRGRLHPDRLLKHPSAPCLYTHWLHPKEKVCSKKILVKICSYPCNAKVVPSVRQAWNGAESKVDGASRCSSEPNARLVRHQHLQVAPLQVAGRELWGFSYTADKSQRGVDPISLVSADIGTWQEVDVKSILLPKA